MGATIRNSGGMIPKWAGVARFHSSEDLLGIPCEVGHLQQGHWRTGAFFLLWLHREYSDNLWM